jgi:nucleotide-binding universal stress UspA family protein
MIYRTIMVQLDVDSLAKPRIRFAWDLARRFEADLVGFAACQPRAYFPVSDSGLANGEMLRQQLEEIEKRLNEIKEEFHSETGDSDLASWRGVTGEPTRELLKHARAADLIVSGTEQGKGFRDHFREIDPGSLILAAGRPVLFASGKLAPIVAEKVFICWKDTRESRRAVIDAMPFLVHAKDVMVATVEEVDGTTSRDDLLDVVRFLIKHGVDVRSETLSRIHKPVGEILSAAAAEFGADLIVSGGFGHSRLREWVLGGATQTLLHDDSLNRLMSS